jgi:hypothetical protein
MRFNDRLRKREERRRDREAALARQAAANAELRAKLIAATHGNFTPGPALDDVSPIRAALELVPLDSILQSIRMKTDRRIPKDFGGDLPTLVFRSHLCDRPLHSDMTVSGHLFSKTNFDDIIVRRPICLWPPEPAYRATLVSAPAHLEEET